MKFTGFIGGSYQSDAVTADQERTVNWYPEILESPGATAKAALYPTPGLEEIAKKYNGPGRAHWAMNDREFLLVGNWLWEADEDGTLYSHGNLPGRSAPGSTSPLNTMTPATMVSSGDLSSELFITADNYALYYDLTEAVGAAVPAVAIAALDGKATMGGYLDGYFLALDTSTSILYISNLGDVTTWDTGTDFTQRNLAADPWKAMKVVGRYIWLFGEHTTEIWQDTGDRFPFAPIPSAIINYGIAAPWSVTIVDNQVVWLAQNESGKLCVMRASGVTPQVISTHPLESAIAGYSDYAEAVADSYSDKGHSFYLLNFDTTGITHAWDARTGLWHERGTWNPVTHSYSSWRPRYHQFVFGEHRILDHSRSADDGGGRPSSFYRMSSSLTTDVDGVSIRRMRRAPTIMNENKRVFYSSFELDLEPGLGTSGQGEDPQVMMRMSDDGGKTWGTERMRSAGKMGEYSNRVRWNRLGAARRRVFEVSVTDPIPWKLTGAYLPDEAGR